MFEEVCPAARAWVPAAAEQLLGRCAILYSVAPKQRVQPVKVPTEIKAHAEAHKLGSKHL